MKYLFFILLLTVSSLSAQSFTPLWEVTGLEAPESVVFDPNTDRYYVSNVAGQPAEKNGQGFITILGKSGEVIDLKWVTGLNAPKGLGLYYDELYVADVDEVVVINVRKGEIVKRFPAVGATFLNDVEISPDGVVYISDTFGGNAIYRIRNGKITRWLHTEALNYPNGLLLQDDGLYVASWGVVTNPETFGTEVPGKLIKVDLATKELKAISGLAGNLDGLERVNGKFLVTDWIAGGLLTISDTGVIEKVKKLPAGSADFYHHPGQKLILVPQMLDGKLTALRYEE